MGASLRCALRTREYLSRSTFHAHDRRPTSPLRQSRCNSPLPVLGWSYIPLEGRPVSALRPDGPGLRLCGFAGGGEEPSDSARRRTRRERRGVGCARWPDDVASRRRGGELLNTAAHHVCRPTLRDCVLAEHADVHGACHGAAAMAKEVLARLRRAL